MSATTLDYNVRVKDADRVLQIITNYYRKENSMKAKSVIRSDNGPQFISHAFQNAY